MKTYLFSYNDQGAECVFEIRADSTEDAKRRVALVQYAKLDGELVAKIPASNSMAAILSPLLRFLISVIPGKGK